MTWTKLSDDFTDDCWTLSDEAYRLHSEGLIWSNRKLLDLRIPKEDLRRFKRYEAVQELLDTGFWLDGGTHYFIRHHAKYQRTREAVVKQQEVSQANGRKGGRPAGTPREQVGDLTQNETQKVTQQLTQSKTGGYLKDREPEPVYGHGNTGDITQQLTQLETQQLTQGDRTGKYEEATYPSNSSMNVATPITAVNEGGASNEKPSPEALALFGNPKRRVP